MDFKLLSDERIKDVKGFEVTYMCVPHGWDMDRSYLICRKKVSHTSKGREILLYEVIKRWSLNGYGNPPIFTNTLKGSEYTKNELKLIKTL